MFENPWHVYWSHARKKRRISIWVKVCIPIAVLASLTTLAAVNGSPSRTKAPPAQAGPVKHYPVDVAPDADPRQFYWSMLKRQSMKTVTDHLHMTFTTPYVYRTQFQGGMVKRIAVDYKSRNFISEFADVERDGKPKTGLGANLMRCVGGILHTYNLEKATWAPPRANERSDECAERMQPGHSVSNSFTSDGIAAGGLSAAEADAFISYLDGIPGLFTVDKVQKTQAKDGKPYLQLDVTLRPVPQGETTLGMGLLETAFEQTGKKVTDHPYSIDIGATQGRRIRYYIDTETMLPSYSVMMSLRPIKLDGSPTDDDRFSRTYYLVEYGFPEQLDPSASRAEGTPTIPYRPWPFEQARFES